MVESNCTISNTFDGQGEIDIDKLNESANIQVTDEYLLEDEECDSCTI